MVVLTEVVAMRCGGEGVWEKMGRYGCGGRRKTVAFMVAFWRGQRRIWDWGGIFVLVLGVLNSKRIMLPNLVGRDTVCNQPVFQFFFWKMTEKMEISDTVSKHVFLFFFFS